MQILIIIHTEKPHYKPKVVIVRLYHVRPWGVEPQSKEPESFILSIELRAHSFLFCGVKLRKECNLLEMSIG